MRRRSFFPDPESADATGLVAVTEHIDPDLLLDAYGHGIFPWSEDPVCWYSPDPRAIFVPERVHLPRKLGKVMRHNQFSVSFDRAFTPVMQACAEAHREAGTWITSGFLRAYGELHQQGHAHSVEVWQGDTLAGGLYGIQLGGLFAGESMFYRVPNASKVAFSFLVEQLGRVGTQLMDAQVLNRFTLQLGAVLIRRGDYLKLLKQALTVQCRWSGERWPEVPPVSDDEEPSGGAPVEST